MEAAMERAVLDGMLLASRDPQRLGAWYAAAFDPDDDVQVEGYRIMRFGPVDIVIDSRDDIGEVNPEPGRVILNFAVDDAHAAVDRLEAAGTRWIAELEDRDGSLFATAADPDGNYIQVIQMNHEPPVGLPTGHETDMEAGPERAVPVAAAFSSFSVDDLDAAAAFYGGTLGLQVSLDGSVLLLHLPGGQDVLIYDKPEHRPASFTVLNLRVPDIVRAVIDLTERGIRFELYEGFDQDDLGIDRSEPGPLIAWFRDPAGNILSVLEPS